MKLNPKDEQKKNQVLARKSLKSYTVNFLSLDTHKKKYRVFTNLLEARTYGWKKVASNSFISLHNKNKVMLPL